MKTQASQQNTPKCLEKLIRQHADNYQQRTPVRQDNFLNLYEKYLNCQGRNRSQKVNDLRSPLQQSTSLHYLTKKQDVGVHRFSLDNFNLDKSTKGLKSYLTTINSSNSIQNPKGNSSYFPNKNDSSQGRSPTAEGQSILTDECKSQKTHEKFIMEMVSKTKRLNDKIEQSKSNSKSPNLAQLLRGCATYQKREKNDNGQIEIRKLMNKAKLILDKYRKENSQLHQHNTQLIHKINTYQEQLRNKDVEIQQLKMYILNH